MMYVNPLSLAIIILWKNRLFVCLFVLICVLTSSLTQEWLVSQAYLLLLFGLRRSVEGHSHAVYHFFPTCPPNFHPKTWKSCWEGNKSTHRRETLKDTCNYEYVLTAHLGVWWKTSISVFKEGGRETFWAGGTWWVHLGSRRQDGSLRNTQTSKMAGNSRCLAIGLTIPLNRWIY